MKKAVLFLIILISSVFTEDEDEYEELISETVTESYCTEVISNITKLLEEGYIFLDFYKSPLKGSNDEIYDIEALDLIEELNAVSKTNRTFYGFIRDIRKIFAKTGDDHLQIYPAMSPGGKNLTLYFFTLPYSFEVVDEFDEDGQLRTYLALTSGSNNEEEEESDPGTDDIFPAYNGDDENIPTPDDYLNKKIETINGEDPFDFIENFFANNSACHSPQANFVNNLERMDFISIHLHPFYKEELSNITIKVEDIDEELTIDYEFNYANPASPFGKYLIKQVKEDITNKRPIKNIKKIYKEFKLQYKLNNKEKLRNLQTVDWDYSSKKDEIKCKVDDEKKKNVLYQNTFYPADYDDYEGVMLNCLDAFYSNDYEIIVIESQNGGGSASLCFPMTQYFRPKTLGTVLTATKETDLNYECLSTKDENLNNETCKAYDSREKLYRGTVDDYGNGVIHNRTKGIELYSIYSKKEMETNRRKYIETNKTKKPTEIIIFTDGYSFSCGSIFIKGMQVYGSAIVVGYQAKPDITSEKDFDASQSNSGVEFFENSESKKNLVNLGFNGQVTYMEQFDPNDVEDPKIPMEFKKYPVDVLSDIHVKYEDQYYDRFIETAEEIFKKYNEDMECNPDNDLLYYETDECDSKLNDEHGHGGYICGEDGQWDTDNCVLKYCDVGYILDIQNKKCIEDPCENIEIIDNITLNCSENLDNFNIEPNKGYIFTINDQNNKNCSLFFYSEFNNFFFLNGPYNSFYPITNGTKVANGTKVYSNIFMNTTEVVKISIKNTSQGNSTEKGEEEEEEEQKNTTTNYFRGRKKSSNKMSTAGIILISILVPLAAAGIAIAAIILTRKSVPITKIESYPNTEHSLKRIQ